MKNKYLNIGRYVFLIGPVFSTLLVTPVYLYTSFVLISLFLIINAQIRQIVSNALMIRLSLIVDVPLIMVLCSLHKSFMFFVLFTSLIDALLKSEFETESYLLSLYLGLGLVYTVKQSFSLNWVIVFLLFYLGAFFVLHQLRQELRLRISTEELYDQISRNNYDLEAARLRLVDYSKQVEKITQLEERNRISRELHDSIGHSLSGILMQVDAARQIIKTDRVKGLFLLDSAYKNINQSIETVKKTVRQLQPAAYQNYVASLRELITNYEKATGVDISLEFSGIPFELFPSGEITIYRNIQEALTNAVRHGNAKNIYIKIIYEAHTLKIFISNDGVGTDKINKGLGLTGMEERLDLIGGSITYDGKNGFDICMIIPRKEI